MANFYIPPTKQGLIAALVKQWPQDHVRFKVMGKRQLLAVFYKLRNKQLTINKGGEIENNQNQQGMA